MDLRKGGLRLSPIRSRGEGRLARLGALGPPPPRAGLWTPSSRWPATKATGHQFRPILGEKTCRGGRK
eukprot:15312940-Alexandrium_andersonii.AAC.1